MNKRWMMLPVALLLITGLILTGCDDDKENPDNSDPNGNETDTGTAYTVKAQNGVLHKVNTTIILFEFESPIPRGGLTLADVIVTDGTGSIDKASMSDSSGPTRMLNISVKAEGEVKIKINKAGISKAEQTVMVYKKLGYQQDSTVKISDVVKFGTPIKGDDITFARYDGDPMASLKPVSKDPVSSMSAANPGLVQTIATFNPPLDLKTEPGVKEFKWFDMVWDNLGTSWEFTTAEGTLETLNLHQAIFQLVLTTATDETIRFQVTSQTHTTTQAKAPVRFMKADILTTEGNTAWGNGHDIKAVTIQLVGMQLRSPENTSWPGISATRAPTLEDMWVISLEVDMIPPLTKVLYTRGGWDRTIIEDPKWGFGDSAFDEGGEDAEPIPTLTGKEGEQKVFHWKPIDITLPGTEQYTTLVIMYTAGIGENGQASNPSVNNWYGFGTISETETGDRVKQQNFDGSGASLSRGIRIPLSMSDYAPDEFHPKKFSGFFIQFNSGIMNITDILLE